jgi:DNA repair protein RadC
LNSNKIRIAREPAAPDLVAPTRTRCGGILERLLRSGPRALADCELLALLLGGGGRRDALELAVRLLGRYGGLAELAAARPQVLQREPGLGPARAVRLTAARELGVRSLEPRRRLGLVVRGPGDLAPALAEEFRGLDREHFLGLYLDARHRLACLETISIGSLNASLVHPREVFKPAVALGAAAVIVAHNHPSGCAQPSVDDLELTRRLAGCGQLLGIELLDHLVWGGGRCVSLREEGWPLPEPPREELTPRPEG